MPSQTSDCAPASRLAGGSFATSAPSFVSICSVTLAARESVKPTFGDFAAAGSLQGREREVDEERPVGDGLAALVVARGDLPVPRALDVEGRPGEAVRARLARAGVDGPRAAVGRDQLGRHRRRAHDRVARAAARRPGCSSRAGATDGGGA